MYKHAHGDNKAILFAAVPDAATTTASVNVTNMSEATRTTINPAYLIFLLLLAQLQTVRAQIPEQGQSDGGATLVFVGGIVLILGICFLAGYLCRKCANKNVTQAETGTAQPAQPAKPTEQTRLLAPPSSRPTPLAPQL